MPRHAVIDADTIMMCISGDQSDFRHKIFRMWVNGLLSTSNGYWQFVVPFYKWQFANISHDFIFISLIYHLNDICWIIEMQMSYFEYESRKNRLYAFKSIVSKKYSKIKNYYFIE